MAEQSADYSKYILPVGGVLVLLAAAQKFGLIPSAESRKKEHSAAELDRAAEWKRGYAKKVATAAGYKKYTTNLLKSAAALALASDLYKSKGLFNDNEDAVYSTLKRLQYKSQLSQLADVFYAQYKLDLATYLKSFMSEAEQARAFDLVAELPTGVTQV